MATKVIKPVPAPGTAPAANTTLSGLAARGVTGGNPALYRGGNTSQGQGSNPLTPAAQKPAANTAQLGQTQHRGPGGGVALPPSAPVGAPILDMTSADKLLVEAGGSALATGQANAARQAMGSAGLNALQGGILAGGTPPPTLGQNLTTALSNAPKQPLTNAIAGVPTSVMSGAMNRPAATMPTNVTPGALNARPGANPLTAGVGQGSIDEVDAALTGYDPRFGVPGNVNMGALPGREQAGALPGTGQMGALPGTVQGGALPGNASMGALPGASDRNLQMSALDRVLGYNANTASLAQAQLADATQGNLSNSLALARSARGGPAAQAQAMRAAQAEGAATMSQQARDLAMLRAKEEDTAKQRELEALGLGGDLTTSIRGSDVLERGQNVQAITDALNADVTQRGQTIQSRDNDVASGTTQRGQTIESLMNDRNAGVTERGQTIQSLDNTLNAGVTQRGQDVGALETQLTQGVAQRGQTLDANQAMSRNELDAILGRGGLAQAERQAGVSERGQTLDAVLGTENVKQARDAVASSSMTEAEKTQANILIARAQLGYELTPEEQFRMRTLMNKANEPGTAQTVIAGVQAGGTLLDAVVPG